MKTAIALLVAGIAIVAGSLTAWSLSRPQIEVGDVARFEQQSDSLSSAISIAPQQTATSEPSDIDPSDVRATQSAAVPRFTVSEPSTEIQRVPVGIHIPALDQKADVNPVGVEPNGEMTVPDNVTDVAWYEYGPSPGELGSAVLAAHVDLAGQGPGVFFELGTLDLGSLIFVEFDDGSTESYRVEARTTYQKEDLPTDAIFRRDGPPVLTLITCGGAFNESIRRYDSNVVVYAVPTALPSTEGPPR